MAWGNETIWKHKKLIDEKNVENVPSVEVVEVLLDQCNLVDNQYNKSLMYYTLLRLINLIHIL